MKTLYIVRSYGINNTSYLKLGYSSRVEKRIKTYKAYNPLIEVLYIKNREDALEVEQAFHSRHTPVFKREWYIYTDELLAEMVRYINSELNSIKYIKKKPKYNNGTKMCNMINRNVKRSLAKKLYWIVGKRKANRLVGMGINTKIYFSPDSSYRIRLNTKTNQSKSKVLPLVLNYLNVSSSTKSKIRKEIKKLFYQMYKNDIKEVYVNSKLDADIDYDLLMKYNILVDEVSGILIIRDIDTIKRNEEIKQGWRDEEIKELLIL